MTHHHALSFAIALSLSSAACGGDPSAAGSGGHGGDGGEGGAGGATCGARDTSDDPTFAELIDFTEAWQKDNGSPGVAVGVILRQGQEWVEHTAGLGVRAAGSCDPITGDTLFRDWSASFLLSELAALVAIDGGELTLDAPVTDVVPSLSVAPGPHGDADAITVRHLLDDTSGLPESLYAFAGTPHTFLDDPCAADGSLETLFANPQGALFYPPGWAWAHSDAARALAGLAVERAAGKPYAQAVHDDVIAPLRLSATYDLAEVEMRDHAAPHPSGSAGCAALDPLNRAYASVRDVLALMREVGGSTLVSPATWSERYQPAPQSSGVFDNAYPAGASMPLDGVTVVDATGSVAGFQSCVVAVPERGFAVAVLTNLEKSSGWHAPCSKALELFLGIELPSYDHGSSALDEYVGAYRDPVGIGDGPRLLDIAIEEGALVASLRLEGDSAAQELALRPSTVWWWYDGDLYPDTVDRDVFALSPTDKRVRFWRDASGVVTSVGGSAWLTIGPQFFRETTP
jgi:CubicO group peptidase (beta-lactamase class C family)